MVACVDCQMVKEYMGLVSCIRAHPVDLLKSWFRSKARVHTHCTASSLDAVCLGGAASSMHVGYVRSLHVGYVRLLHVITWDFCMLGTWDFCMLVREITACWVREIAACWVREIAACWVRETNCTKVCHASPHNTELCHAPPFDGYTLIVCCAEYEASQRKKAWWGTLCNVELLLQCSPCNCFA